MVAIEWAVIGLLVTILVGVGTAMGAIIKIAYDVATSLKVTLHGDEDNGDQGFIEETRDGHDAQRQFQQQMYEQLLIQGRLLSELTYSFGEIAEELEQQDDINVSVDLDRIEKLRERKDDDRWSSDPPNSDD